MAYKRQSDITSEARTAARKLWSAINDLQALGDEWNALDYTTNWQTEVEGDNANMSAGEVGAVIFDTAAAVQAVFNGGHATNIAKLL